MAALSRTVRRLPSNRVHDKDAPPFSSTEEQEQHPVGSLPADVLVRILSRVPYRSLCRFKCVSKPWLALCSDHDIRKRCPQTLSGFFFNHHGRFSFGNLSGRGPPLVDPYIPFLRGSYDRIAVKQCCSGLLCKCWVSDKFEYEYVVCNRMTGRWLVLPPVLVQEEVEGDLVCFKPIDIFLGFDVAIPFRFTMFVPLINCFREVTEMAIYSSETGQWTTVETDHTTLADNPECVFLNETMHFTTRYASLVVVDAKGEVWREIGMPDHMPKNNKFSIGQCQGRLYAWQISNDYDDGGGHLYVWVLKDSVPGK